MGVNSKELLDEFTLLVYLSDVVVEIH